jgi:recombination protein RecT
MSQTSQAIEVAKQGPGALVKEYEDDFRLVLPTHIKPEQWVRVAQSVMRRDPKLAAAARKNPGSFLSAMLRCAHLGLEPGETFHLLPFGNEITGITDYKGEIELMYRAGEVTSVVAEVVHQDDQFDWVPGAMDRPHHTYDHFGDRGEMIGVYAYALLRSGAVSRVVVMGKAEVMRHKAISKTGNRSDSPWQKWPEAMWLKTAVHELRKWVPTSPEYRQELLRSQAAVEDISPALAGELPEPIHTGDTYNDDEIAEGEIVDEVEYAPDDPERPM